MQTDYTLWVNICKQTSLELMFASRKAALGLTPESRQTTLELAKNSLVLLLFVLNGFVIVLYILSWNFLSLWPSERQQIVVYYKEENRKNAFQLTCREKIFISIMEMAGMKMFSWQSYFVTFILICITL